MRTLLHTLVLLAVVSAFAPAEARARPTTMNCDELAECLHLEGAVEQQHREARRSCARAPR